MIPISLKGKMTRVNPPNPRHLHLRLAATDGRARYIKI